MITVSKPASSPTHRRRNLKALGSVILGFSLMFDGILRSSLLLLSFGPVVGITGIILGRMGLKNYRRDKEDGSIAWIGIVLGWLNLILGLAYWGVMIWLAKSLDAW